MTKGGRKSNDPHGDGMGSQGDLLSGVDGPEADDVNEERPKTKAAANKAAVDEQDPAGDPDAPSDSPDGDSDDDPADAVPAEVREALVEARALVQKGRTDEAIEGYHRIVAKHPGVLRARNNLGVLLDEIGQHDSALEQFEAAQTIAPENVEVMSNLGAALGALGRFDEAERELRKAQRLYPTDVTVRANLGVLLFRRGLYPQAEVEFKWVCDRDRDHGPAHFYRGEALNRLGRVDEAIEVLQRVIQLQPENSKAYYTLGILYDRKYQKDEAAQMYRKARELSSLK